MEDPDAGKARKSFLLLYDAGKGRGVSCAAFEGRMSDALITAGVIEMHTFQKACFRVHGSFYSEENIALLRRNERLYDPCPCAGSFAEDGLAAPSL